MLSRRSFCRSVRLSSRNISLRYYVVNSNAQSVLGASLPEREVENKALNESIRLSTTMTRFWNKVETVAHPETKEWQIQLDSKSIKTPQGFPLTLPPSKKQLAHLVAHEWANLPYHKIKTSSMPLTSVVARLVDLDQIHKGSNIVNQEMITKVGTLDDIRTNLLRYLDTDTCLIFAPSKEYEGKLRKRQMELNVPLIEEAQEYLTKYAQRFHPELLPKDKSVNLVYLDCENDGLRGNEQTATTKQIVMQWLKDVSVYDLIAIEKAVLISKSFLCGIALLRSNGCDKAREEFYQVNKSHADDYYYISIKGIVELGNMETIFQIAKWGEVEDTHDVEKAEWIRSLSSAALLCH